MWNILYDLKTLIKYISVVVHPFAREVSPYRLKMFFIHIRQSFANVQSKEVCKLKEELTVLIAVYSTETEEELL